MVSCATALRADAATHNAISAKRIAMLIFLVVILFPAAPFPSTTHWISIASRDTSDGPLRTRPIRGLEPLRALPTQRKRFSGLGELRGSMSDGRCYARGGGDSGRNARASADGAG